jgi:hypothetical protein
MWLKEIEVGMKWTLYEKINEAIEDFSYQDSIGDLSSWILKWPGQIIVLVL